MLTIKKDVRDRFVGARDQGPRPTCLAFALSDAHAAERPPHVSLSADFLYYHALRRMPHGHGDNGVGLTQATTVLRVDGQPLETAWPYAPVLPSDLTKWKPPANVPVLLATGTAQTATVDSVCALLENDQPSVIIFQPSERFFHPDSEGMLPALSPDPQIPGSHAVIAVGYGTQTTRRHVLIRNSWGTGWGKLGHAWLAEDYLAPRLSSVTSIQAN